MTAIYIDSVDYDEGAKKDTVGVSLFEYEFHWVIDSFTYLDGELRKYESNSFLKSKMIKEDAISMARNIFEAQKSFYELGFMNDLV